MKEYIDREALKADLQESYNRLRAIYDCLTFDRDKQICVAQLTTFIEAILRVKDAPAADVVEVRHGRWIKSCVPDIYQCSHCKMPTKMDELCDSETLRAFCPNCGAIMDKEE